MLYRLSKFTYLLFIFYIGWFLDVFFIIPRMPLILGLGMIILLIIHTILTTGKATVTLTKPVLIWLFFVFYLLLSGVFIAYDKRHLLDSIFTYVQTLAMVVYIINVSIIDGDNHFFVKSYIFYSIVYMFTMLFFGVEGRGGRLQLSATSNPNGDGLTLLFGIFCILLLFNTKKITRLIILLGLVSLFVYTIILTGSRKSFIAAALLILLWFIVVFKDYWKEYSIIKKSTSIMILIAGMLLIGNFIAPIFRESSLFLRLMNKGYKISDDVARSGMYKEAFIFFTNSPLFGVGFNHYRLLSVYRTYSHSTYAEIISTTGIIGTIIYFSAYIVIIYNLFNLYRNKRNLAYIKALQYLIFMLIMLVLGTGVIHFYGIRDYMAFALMISFYYIEKKKLYENNLIKDLSKNQLRD